MISFPARRTWAVLVFAVTSMPPVGLAHSAKQILGPLRDLRALARALLGPARRWAPVARRTSTVGLVVIVLTTTLANIPTIITRFAEAAIVPALLVVAGAFVIGYLLGGRDRDVRNVLALGTSQRNIAAATVMATQRFAGNETLVMVIVTSRAGFALLFPVAAVLRRRESTTGARSG